MRSKKIRVGIAGCGGIGNYHAMAVCANPDCELVALFDSNPQSVERVGASCPTARQCSTFAEFLDTPGMNAVIVATPNNVHAPYATAAAKRGMHVLCEKPIAMNPAEAKKMVKAIRDNGVVGMANFGYRAIPSFRAIREMVRAGRFGRIFRVRVEFLQSTFRDPEGPLTWRNIAEYAGFGTLGDLGSHMIDIAVHLLGTEPRRAVGVHAVNVPTRINPSTGKKAKVTADTDAQFMIDFGSFAGAFETSQAEASTGSALAIQVSAEKGSFRLSSLDRSGYEIALDESRTNTNGIPLARQEVPKEMLVEGPFNADFFLAIRKKIRNYPNFEDAYLVQKALDAVHRSTLSGRWEKI
jgi:predicted dehydrogenase